jgi:hypothetical protein
MKAAGFFSCLEDFNTAMDLKIWEIKSAPVGGRASLIFKVRVRKQKNSEEVN